MSLWGEPEGIPCCCLSGCCEGFVLPVCITLALESSCCPGDIATIVLIKEDVSGGGSDCAGGTPRPFNAATNFCGATPAIVYTGALPMAWCPGSGLGDATVLVFCCIDPITGEKSWWIYIGGNDLGVDWYPASTAHYYRLTLVSCDPFLLQINATPPDCGESTCVWTWQAVCFIEGTLVRTPQGEVVIESLMVGDVITDIHGESVTVLDVIPTEVDFLLRITAENGTLTGVTPEHPFIALDMESTIEAKDLTPGQSLPLNKMIVDSQLFRATNGKFKVFNLRVSGSNTFIADGFAVHNKGQS